MSVHCCIFVMSSCEFLFCALIPLSLAFSWMLWIAMPSVVSRKWWVPFDCSLSFVAPDLSLPLTLQDVSAAAHQLSFATLTCSSVLSRLWVPLAHFFFCPNLLYTVLLSGWVPYTMSIFFTIVTCLSLCSLVCECLMLLLSWLSHPLYSPDSECPTLTGFPSLS